MKPVPWQTGEICGPDSAKSLNKADQLKRAFAKSKKPLLIVGSEAATMTHGKGDMIDYAIDISPNKQKIETEEKVKCLDFGKTERPLDI